MSTEPTTRLILFGGATLEGERGPIAGRSAQRRRLALLAILAVSRRALSRDKLIGYLWEESDADKARKLLSESVYVIRKSLGEDAILATGDELRLNSAVVWCDAEEFVQAAQAADDARAVAQYKGPLLDGFFISDATEFEQWVDRERDRLAREQGAALTRLARKSEEQFDYQDAVRWWEKLCAHDQFGTVPALGLMRALDAAGDRTNALKYARTHANRLQAELGAEPDSQIEAFANELRAKPFAATPARVAQIKPDVRAAPSEFSGLTQVAVAATNTTTLPKWWPKRVTLALVLLSIASTVIVMLFWPSRPPTAGSATKAGRLTIAVLPTSAIESALDRANAVAHMLSTSLDGAGEVHTVDPHRLLTSVASERGNLTPVRAARLVKPFNAQMFVLVDVVPAGSQYTITGSLYDTAQPDSAPRKVQVDGQLDSLHVMIDNLSRGLLSASGHLPADRLRGVAAVTTPSYPAYKLYLQGDDHFLAGRYADAVKFFKLAVAQDSNFALAYYRLSAASEWNFDFADARASARRAQTLSVRLPAQQRRLIAPWVYLLSGDYRNAETLYSNILTEDPDDVEARAGLAEVLVHYNPVRGAPADSARPLLDRVLHELPEFGEARFHQLEFAARAGNLARFDSIYSGIAMPNQQQLGWDAVRAFTWGTPLERRVVLRQLDTASEKIVGTAAGRVAAHTHNFSGAESIVARLTKSELPEWRAVGLILRAQLALAASDWKRAKRDLEEAEKDEEDWSRELTALYLLHPLVNASREQLLGEIAGLRNWNPQMKDASLTFFFGVHALVRPVLRLYLLGLLSAAAGDTVNAEDYRRQLAQMRSPDDIALSLSHSLQGHIALAKGQDSTALVLLRRGDADVRSPLEFLALSPFYSRAHDRFTIAMLSARLGKRAEAIRWYRSFLDSFDFVYAAAADSALADLYSPSDTLKAREYRAAYLRLTRRIAPFSQ